MINNQIVMSLKLFMAKEDFLSKHSNPKVLVLEKDTEVLNMEGTSNHHPNGDFDNSWTKYWIAFSEETKLILCSQCGKALWNEENRNSVKMCKDILRQRKINCDVEGKDNEEKLEDYISHGSHVEIDGVTYITPLCIEHNTSNKGEMITLKKGSILVEEVDPIIE